MEVKLDILKRKEQGEGTSAISRNLGLAQLTVWTVLKNRERHHVIEYVASER